MQNSAWYGRDNTYIYFVFCIILYTQLLLLNFYYGSLPWRFQDFISSTFTFGELSYLQDSV